MSIIPQIVEKQDIATQNDIGYYLKPYEVKFPKTSHEQWQAEQIRKKRRFLGGRR